MKCNKCGYDNPNDSNYCINCGEKLEKSNEMICPHCGAKIYNDSVFCSVCGNALNNTQVIEEKEELVKPKVKMNVLAKVALVLAICGATITIFAYTEYLALGGLTISTIALVMIAVGLLSKKIAGNIGWAIGLGIYGVIANIIIIAFLVWMLPSF